MSHCSASVIVLTSSTNCNAVITSSTDRNAVGEWVDLRVCAMTQPPSRIRGSTGQPEGVIFTLDVGGISLALVRIEEDGVLSGYRLHYQRVAPNGDVLVDEDLRFELQIH
jgi:hypothetical protein